MFAREQRRAPLIDYLARHTERLRFTPTPFHDDKMFDHLVRAMDQLWSHCNVKRLGGVAA